MIDSTEIDSYIAGDVYEIWQSSINCATDEILVVTPYFNNVLKELIESKLKSSNFERKNIKILTRFSSELAWGDKAQLSVGIELIEMGVELRQLNNIHAKLLIVDKIELVLGSQNFTNNGRQAREASVSAWYMLENRNYDNFLTSIDLWWEEATLVKAELLRELLEELEDLENSPDFLKDDFNINVNLVNEYNPRDNLNFKFRFDGEFLASESLCNENDSIENLANIIFQSFICKKPFLKACEAPGDFFPLHFSFYQNLKITVQTTTNNSKVLICTY